MHATTSIRGLIAIGVRFDLSSKANTENLFWSSEYAFDVSSNSEAVHQN